MNTITWTWEDFWIWYTNLDDEKIKEETLKHIDLPRLFKSLNTKEKTKFLEYVPVSIRKSLLTEPQSTVYKTGKVVML